jgi:RHS repeat-associated protein
MRAPSPSRSWARRRLPLLIGSIVCAGLVGTLGLSPAWAQGGDAAAPAPVVGDFALGDGAEGLIDERTGAVSLTLPVAAGLTVKWSSAAAGSNEDLLGPGWGWAGLGRVDVDGGVRVFPTSGVGVFDADASYDSGMAGYLTGDAAFAVADGEVLPARADGRVGERPYRFVMAELGGTRTYYSAEGRPIAQADLHGNRTDYEWADQQLTRVVDPLGVVTELVWEGTRKVKVTSRAGEAGSTMQATLELSQKRIVAVVDPTGARTTIHYSGELIDRIEGPSGAVTRVSWAQPALDGSVPVEGVAVVDEQTNETLSARTWEGTGSATGWPAQAASATYETVVSDGQSRVSSKYASNSLLLERTLDVATAAGRQVMQEQSFVYPGTDGSRVANPAAPPANWTKPERAELVYRDETGRERTVTGEYEYDGLGRPTKQVENDGTTTTTTYDDEAVPRPEPLPGDVQAPAIGLPVVQRTTALDGLVTETKVERNDAGTAVVATESYSGRDGEELVRTARAEMTVEADGFISREVSYPQGGEGDPFVTEWQRSLDPVAGRLTLTQTDAAGTSEAATATTVTDLLSSQVVEEIDRLGNRTVIGHDEAGREISRTDGSGRTTTTAYLTFEQEGVNATSVETPDRVVTTEERDPLGRVTRVWDNIDRGAVVDGHQRVSETRAYPDPGTVEITDAWGATSSTKRDVFGRIVETRLNNGLVVSARHDDIANTVTTGSSPTGRLEDAETTTTELRDDNGAVIETRTIRADGANALSTSSQYDGLGRRVASSDGVSKNTVAFDALGNPFRSVTEATGGIAETTGSSDRVVAEREFDEYGNSRSKTLATASETKDGAEQHYDARGRLTKRIDQRGLPSTWQYSPDGLIERSTTGYGRTTTSTYDPKTRSLLETRTESPIGETVTTAYTYDPVTDAQTGVYDPADRDGTEISYTRDAWGNVTRATYPTGLSIVHEYDEHGRLLATTDTTGAVTRLTYDRSGLVTEAVQTAGDCDEGDTQDCVALARVAYEYDIYGRTTAQRRGNGVDTRFEFTSSGQVANEVTSNAQGETISERSYTYDERGNLTRELDQSTAPGVEASVETTEYAYDLHNRLISSVVRAGSDRDSPIAAKTEYQLSIAGNIAAETRTTLESDVAESTTRAFEYSPAGEATAIVTDGVRAIQEYDRAGNLVRGADGTVYTYNALNQVVAETRDGSTTTTAYWADGSRRSLAQGTFGTADFASTEYYWDGGELLSEAHVKQGASSGMATHLLGSDRQARTVLKLTDSPKTAYLVADRHRSTTHLTDDAGHVSGAYTYSDYGVATQYSGDGAIVTDGQVGDASRNPIQYSGQVTDPSGDQYLRTRMYDSDTALFRSEDPEPLFNRFSYADLNPVMMVDPSGRTAIADITHWLTVGVGILAAAVGIAAAVVSTVTTGGVAALGWAGAVSTLVAGGADAWGMTVAIGGLLSRHKPEWVSPGAQAFFTSKAVMWSEAVVGLAAMGSAVLLAKSVRNAADPVMQARLLWRKAAHKLADTAEEAAGRRVISYADAKRMLKSKYDRSIQDPGLADDNFTSITGGWREGLEAIHAGQTQRAGALLQAVTDERLQRQLRAVNQLEAIAVNVEMGDSAVLMTAVKQHLRARLIEAFPWDGANSARYGHALHEYTPRVTFMDTRAQVLWVDNQHLGRPNDHGLTWEPGLMPPGAPAAAPAPPVASAPAPAVPQDLVGGA